MSQEVLDQFARFRRRHHWVRAWDLFLETAFVMGVTAGAMLLLDRLAFEAGLSEPHLSSPGMVITTLAGTILLAAGLSAALLFLRPLPPAVLAWQVDRAAGTDERFLSALEISSSGNGGLFAEALARDASRAVRELPASRVVPRARLGYRWAVALLLATGGLLCAFPPRVYEVPRADFEAAPLRGPAPLEVAFRDASIGAIHEFAWDFGDGRTASGEELTHVYEKPGDYVARLRLRGPGGESEKRCTVRVLPSDRAAADFRGRPLKGRGRLEVRFENLSLNAKRYAWDFGDGKTSTEAAATHLYEKPGLYTVSLRAANDLNEDLKVRERYVRVAHPDEPIAEFRALPREGEAPLEVGFEDLSSGAITEWAWDFGELFAGEGEGSREPNPTHVYRRPGWYTVRLRVKGPHGEDEEEKVRFIHVKSEGEGSGQGGPQGGPPRPPKPRATGGPEGRLEAEPPPRPKVTLVPENLRHHDPRGDLVDKDVNVVAPRAPGAPGAPSETQPLKTALPRYTRVAEDSIERELVPPALRDPLRRYYEGLQPTR
jgi:PKD repeat protein